VKGVCIVDYILGCSRTRKRRAVTGNNTNKENNSTMNFTIFDLFLPVYFFYFLCIGVNLEKSTSVPVLSSW